MGRYSPSGAKNFIKRSLIEIIDPYPKKIDIDKIWQYFNSQCAYCGKEIYRQERKGHLDHLDAINSGGTNSIYNFVLACSVCNGDEKREMVWTLFLRKKADGETYEERKRKIEYWKNKETINNNRPNIDQIINEALANYELSVKKVRGIRSNIKNENTET